MLGPTVRSVVAYVKDIISAVIEEALVVYADQDLTLPMTPIGDDGFLVEGMGDVLVRFERNDDGEVIAVNSHHHGIEARYPRSRE